MRTILTLCLALAAAPAATQSVIPMPPCTFDPETGTFSPAERGQGGHEVWPTMHPGGVVYVEWFEGAEAVAGLVQHCPSGAALRWRFRADPEGRGRGAIRAMLDSPVVHGFDDLRSEVRYHGGRARQVASPGRCACEAVRAAGS